MTATALLEVESLVRCPTCRGPLSAAEPRRCERCGVDYPLVDGVRRMLDENAPGIAEKRREMEGWVSMAREQEWYEPDDEVDAVLPYVCRDLGWDDPTWRATEYSFASLLELLRPGMRVLEIGAAKCWGSQHVIARGCTYVGADILADPNIGLGRGLFYEELAGQPFLRVQADGEGLPFASASFDVTYCVATLHHALDLGAMVGEMSRVTRPGGHVLALNEGSRALRQGANAPTQEEALGFGINEHVHTIYAYVWALARHGVLVRRIFQADGYDGIAGTRAGGTLLRLPLVGRAAATLYTQSCCGYQGVSLVGRRLGRR